jgi:hypothetical protein
MRALVAIAVLAAAPAAALTPVPECYDEATGSYDVVWHGKGFAFYSYGQDDGSNYVLEDCPGGRRLLMTPAKPKPGEDQWESEELLYNKVFDALESPQSYSMQQIAGIARRAGAKTTLGKATYRSCACEKYGE